MSNKQAPRVFPKPISLSSRKFIEAVWALSKDNRGNGGAKGVDGITPYFFKGRLETNFSKITQTLRDGSYSFSPLKAFLIDKKNEGYRVICIPTVQDRLVQRLILAKLTYNTKTGRNIDQLKIDNGVAYGFRKRKRILSKCSY